jgi:hypothetical protein
MMEARQEDQDHVQVTLLPALTSVSGAIQQST